jgi:cardiolipin synthase
MYEFILWIGTHAQFLFTANTILLAFVIVLENREPERSQGWLLVLFAFPIIGFLVYLFIGHNWHRYSLKKQREIAKQTREWREKASRELAKLKMTDPLEKRIRMLASGACGLIPTSDNSIHVLTNAQEKYPRLLEAIRTAKTSIDMEYYIFRYDAFGKEVVRLLIERAKAGVRVRFLVDGYGSIGLGAKAFPAMRAAGIKAHYFAPLATLFYFFKVNYRDHRKLVIVDDEIAFTGGINIGLDYLGQTSRGPWRDTAVELRGSCVQQFKNEFNLSWYRTTRKSVDFASVPVTLPANGRPEGDIINVIPSGPDSAWFAIQRMYLEMIHSAQTSILIQTPYFIPDESISEALMNAALRGVQITLMMPREVDFPPCRWVAITYFGEMLRAGARAYEYQAGFLHQKIMVIDETLASIGTCNIDIRSLKTDFEINILTSSPSAIRRLLDDAKSDLAASTEFTVEQYLNRPLSERLRESFARLIAPLL